MAICGLSSAAWIRDENLLSIFDCMEQGRQSVVCLQQLGALMTICSLSPAAWSRNGSLWSVFWSGKVRN